jgi:hypothetical protein
MRYFPQGATGAKRANDSLNTVPPQDLNRNTLAKSRKYSIKEEEILNTRPTSSALN